MWVLVEFGKLYIIGRDLFMGEIVLAKQINADLIHSTTAISIPWPVPAAIVPGQAGSRDSVGPRPS